MVQSLFYRPIMKIGSMAVVFAVILATCKGMTDSFLCYLCCVCLYIELYLNSSTDFYHYATWKDFFRASQFSVSSGDC